MSQSPLPRTPRHRIDGILLLAKSVGLSSNAALQRARGLFGAAKAGHAGTLDPLASGLLPVCFGEATKFAQVLLDASKRYRATIRFGAATTTGDAEGEVTMRSPVAFDRASLESAVSAMLGRIAQVPPAYAALKRDGRAYYDYARAGIAIERTAREVEIHAIAVVDWSPPDAVVDIECSKGTYVRVLAEDLGLALGSCAHLAGLCRTASAGFSLDDAVDLAALEAMDASERLRRLLPVDAGLQSIQATQLSAGQAQALLHGQRPPTDLPAGRYRGYAPDRFVGLVESAGGELVALRLIGTAPATEGGP